MTPPSLEIKRTDALDADFKKIVEKLDIELAKRDGDDHAFYAQFNKVEHIKHVIVVYVDNLPVSCGAIKAYDSKTMEVKRMFTEDNYRGQGLASKILSELEKWAAELAYEKCILETGLKQPEAIRLYEKSGYALIPNYGQYKDVEDSKCFEKLLK